MAILFTVILAFLASSAFAKPIKQSEAQNIASNIAKNKKHSAKLKTKKLRNLQMKFAIENAETSSFETEEALYYVFDIGENDGFAIIAGDDTFNPVLGISENGKFDYENMPPNFAWYLQNLEQEIEYALQIGQTASVETEIEWEDYSSAPYIAGTYLIQTTWGQSSPYNYICPLIYGNRAITGCIATSMSQIMKYHAWPQQISGEIPGYTTRTESVFVSAISRNNLTYDWASMANSYTSTETVYEVARIMLHAGTAVQMDYRTNENLSSGAYASDIPKVMPLYFDYDSNIKYIRRDGQYYHPRNYTAIASGTWAASNDSILPYIWDDIMKMQIDSLLPVIYSGSDSQIRHSFILDGYDNFGRFHFNWGWGGQYNGWFVSSVLNPGTRNYSSSQYAVINIMPNSGTRNADLRIFGKNLSVQNSSLDRGEIFNVNATIYNIGTATLPRGKTLGIAILPLNETEFEIIGTAYIDSVMPFNRAREITNSTNLQTDYSLDIESTLPDILPCGSYILKAAVINEDNEWEFIKAATSYSDYVNITACITSIEWNSTVLNLLKGSENFSIQGITKPERIQIFNLKGNMLINKTVMPNESISISHLPKGMYIANVSGKTFKVVK